MTARRCLQWLVCMAMASGAAFADERSLVATLPAYKQECGVCHVPYPPRLLPAQSWARIMSTLPRHYGADASMDAAQVREIGTWLAQEAGTRRRVLPPEDRITRSEWFAHEHGELSASVWKRDAVRSPSNCAACHTQANEGDFRERNIRIPR